MSTGSRVFNRLRVILDRDLTAANALDKAATAHPDRRLFHFESASRFSALSRDPTVREVQAFIHRIGRCLAMAGLKRCDRVAIYKTNSLDYFFLILAVIRKGGIAVPVNSGMPKDRLREHLANTGATMLIVDAAHFAKNIGDPNALPEIQFWLFDEVPPRFAAPAVSVNAEPCPAPGEDSGPAQLAPDDVVMIVHTSGTTGRPKGVAATSRSIVRGIKGHFLGEPISTRNRIGVAGHFSHLVCALGLFTSMVGNIPVWEFPDHAPEKVLAQIEAWKINIFFAFPDVYLAMYLHGLEQYDLSSVKVWIATADASHQVHMKAFCRKGAAIKVLGRKLMGAVFIEPLGSSEVGFAAVERFFFSWTRLRTDRCIGWPTLGGPRARVVDEEARPVPRHHPGRLMVKGPTLFAGYWNESRAGVPSNGWWWTGDIVYKDWLGRYHHLDRDSDVIRTAQGAVYSLPVEECLLQHPGVGEVVVVGLEHPVRGMVPVAMVQPRPGVTLDGEEVLHWTRQRLDVATALAAVVVVTAQQIPRGLTGKVLKREMRERFASFWSAKGLPVRRGTSDGGSAQESDVTGRTPG